MDESQITSFVKKHGSKEFNDNFLGVYAVDKMYKIIENISSKIYPSCIFNTDTSDESGQHWCALHVLNMDNPSMFLFDSFGKLGLKTFLKR